MKNRVDAKLLSSKHFDIKKALLTVILTVYGLFNIFPFIFMLSSSFKPAADIFEGTFKLIPKRFIMTNYIDIFDGSKYNFLGWYKNTIIMVVITIAIKCLIVSMAGYSFARLKFKGKDTLFLIFLSAMMIPGDVLLVPRYVVYKMLGLTNNMWCMVLLYTFDVFFVFMMRQFFVTIPFELSEAATIDGCNQFTVFYMVILPNVKPAFITMILFTLIWQWNDYMNPYIFITDTQKQMLSVGIQMFQQRAGVNYGMQSAGTALILIPIIIVFLFCQQYFIEGIATSGVKG